MPESGAMLPACEPGCPARHRVSQGLHFPIANFHALDVMCLPLKQLTPVSRLSRACESRTNREKLSRIASLITFED
jgi:hypothetical protein